MEKDVRKLSVAELTSPNFVKSIFDDYPDENERNNMLNEIMEVAKDQHVLTHVKKDIDKYNKKINISSNNVINYLILNSKEEPEASTTNYINIMMNDESIFNSMGYDEFADKYVYFDEKGNARTWDDSTDSKLRSYIEREYNIYNQQKYYDALNYVMNKRRFHPIKDIIEKDNWDGIPRIDRFLVDITKCDDNDYYREVSRMIFYGGINRLYNPGCKFDYMPILIGKQGSMKTSIVTWLALNDKYYLDISSIEGKDAVEALQGRWICEFAELLAMVRTKDVEAMKSFVTRSSDKFRASYGKYTTDHPRTCIFIGTTNDYQFLSDKTGNRRYLPIHIGLKSGELMGKEQYVKDYILQCWREALVLYKKGKAYLTIPSEYYKLTEKEQQSVLEDDPKTGQITEYLISKKVGDKVCTIELFTKCFNNIKKNYDRSQGKEISRCMANLPEWERQKDLYRFEDYGPQRYWVKVKESSEEDIVGDKKDNWSDLN